MEGFKIKIREIQIKRYKSLQDISLEDIGDLTTLIGKNSSGKSNILEALNLFFTELDQVIEKNATFNEYMWYNRDSKEPIEFIISIELENESKEIITKELSDALRLEEGGNNLTICRQIVSPSPNTASWVTKYVKLDDAFLIEDGKLAKKTAKSRSKIDGTSETPSASSEAPLPPDLLPELLQNISKAIQGRFKLIPMTRDATGPIDLWNRTSIVPQNTQVQLIALHQSIDRPDEEKFNKIEELLKETPLAGKLSFLTSQILIKEGRNRLPISYIGGGNQEILNLVPSLIEEGVIVGIEEPETHLHSKLAKNLFNILKKASENCQIFITTHFPVFVDKVDIGSAWIVRKENTGTKVTRIREEGDLKYILYELGYKPSDILFADKILLVEGWTEKEVLPIISEKMGHNLLENGISILHIRGKDKGKYHLKMWVEITKNAEIPIFMLLDKNAKKEMDELLKEELIDEDHSHLWSKGDIEDYYPPEILSIVAVEVLENEYGIELTDEDKNKIKESPQIEEIEKVLKKKRKPYDAWKVLIGKEVAIKISEKDINEEIKRVMEKIIRL